MTGLDIAFIFLLVGLGFFGLFSGLVRGVAKVFVTLISAFVAIYLGQIIIPFLPYSLSNPSVRAPAAIMIAFFITYTLQAIAVGVGLNSLLGETDHNGDVLGGVTFGFLRALLITVFMLALFERFVPHRLQPELVRGAYINKVLAPVVSPLPQMMPVSIERQLARIEGLSR